MLLVKASYLVAATLFLLGLQAHGLAAHRAQRHPLGRAGHGDRDGGDVPAARTAQPRADRRRASSIGIGATWIWGKKVAITDMPQMVALFNGMGGGSAAAIGAVELLQVLGAGAAAPSMTTLVLGGGRRADRRDLADRFDHRLGQARRAHGQALHVPRPAVVQRCGVRWSRWCCGGAGDPFARRAGDRRVLRRRARARRADDAADRRRRHAGGDLAVQRADRPRGRVRRLRARQRGADHRRHDGRRGRHAADAADGQGDEPPDQQRAVLQLRRRRRAAGNHRRAEADRGRRRRRDDGLRRARGDRARLRHGRGAGAAQDLGAGAEADGARRQGEVRDPSGRRPHARAT